MTALVTILDRSRSLPCSVALIDCVMVFLTAGGRVLKPGICFVA